MSKLSNHRYVVVEVVCGKSKMRSFPLSYVMAVEYVRTFKQAQKHLKEAVARAQQPDWDDFDEEPLELPPYCTLHSTIKIKTATKQELFALA